MSLSNEIKKLKDRIESKSSEMTKEQVISHNKQLL